MYVESQMSSGGYGSECDSCSCWLWRKGWSVVVLPLVSDVERDLVKGWFWYWFWFWFWDMSGLGIWFLEEESGYMNVVNVVPRGRLRARRRRLW